MIVGNPARSASVLQVIPSLDTGGAERTTIDVAKALAAAGFRPLVASEGGRLEGELRESGGELIRMRLDTKQPLNILANARALARLLRAENVGIVHARSRAPAWSALIAARRTGTIFVTTYHGIYNARTPLKRWYNSVMVRSDAVIANSQSTAQHIRSVYRIRPKLLAVIPRGVDLARFDPSKMDPGDVNSMRQQWGAREQDRVLLLPGRMTRWKGQLVLIDALARLRRESRLKNVRAVLAGDAQGRNDYLAEIATVIDKSGLREVVMVATHIDAMPVAYSAADIVISASTDPEAFGRVPAEAAAMGRPVIATDHGGARETILAGISGLLTDPGDATVLAEAIADLLGRSEGERRAMGERGRAHVQANYSVERMQDQTLKLYRSLLAGDC
jgi:glycosyltransferase involved in cell wall biosynthesis